MNGASNAPMRRPRAIVVAGIGVGTVATASVLHARSKGEEKKRILLPRPLVDAISGAVGELGQILILYPVEAIKIRCQRENKSAVHIVAQLAQNASQPGGVSTVLRMLYSGIGASALFSVAVGSVHWLSFCAAKRAALDLLPDEPSDKKKKGSALQKQVEVSPSAQIKGSSSSSVVAEASAFAAINGPSASGHAAPSTSTSSSVESAKTCGIIHQASSNASSSLPVSGQVLLPETSESEVRSKNSDDKEQEDVGPGLSKRMTANLIAAALGALATALVESPVELFRHQAQAGLISGNLIKEMATSVRNHGPGSLWYGFLPFLMEAFPYDVSELGTYSQLRELHNEACKPSSRHHAMTTMLPADAWDAAMGAAAGAAAVLVSMPCDVVKTHVQTQGVGQLSASPAAQVALFLATGRTLVQQGGLAALFVGVIPRLLQQVPSSTICWYSVEACQKALQPYTDGAPASGGDAGH
ncbi:hypothetical protein CEUSTIGMA_g1222.t1 [Chlamydomonas eustigma]|uniref:Mitochondrial carrier protein n=1 Tax=Chlamydomonas eustigma TaxID=1157962 RepID=A0A250WSL4_9CHLO|nr:hypothetical protein CEUSTIGMA_g1222.t1 [Chlamydomonas eustigma]|eukprot:GAX73771.1 hypothetical protein CEUSTIGMA_g1222.t1 [Chlamydomonas eustigma]